MDIQSSFDCPWLLLFNGDRTFWILQVTLTQHASFLIQDFKKVTEFSYGELICRICQVWNHLFRHIFLNNFLITIDSLEFNLKYFADDGNDWWSSGGACELQWGYCLWDVDILFGFDNSSFKFQVTVYIIECALFWTR